ncbi:MAG: serine protease [Clostridia bacterium]|nr:serine protease [Clostridia bacterium]
MKNRTMKLLALALTLALLTMGTARAETLSVADVYERVCRSVVQVRNMAETWSPDNGATVEMALSASGVVIAEDFVLTNWHVVYEADYMEIETLDGQIVRAKDVYTDESLDLAVLALSEPLKGVTPVTMGDSTAVRTGDLAISIGYPVLEDIVFPATLTVGYISGLNRNSENMGNFTRDVPLIQFDAALNNGGSGGGLFNAAGELIGLSTLKGGLTDDIVYENLGLAIPTATIERVAGDLMAYGVVKRPRMGVMVSDLDGPEEPIRTYPPAGLLASEVDPDGPAGQAGMEDYDVIVEFDGVRVHTFNELSALLDTHAAGDVVRVKVYRCLDEEGYLIDNPEYIEMDITLGILD